MTIKTLTTQEIYQAYMYGYPHKTAYHALNPQQIALAHHSLQSLTKTDLYIHIPFCDQKCGFCNLFSLTQQQTAYFDVYLDAIEQQITELPLERLEIKNIIIGGGTPLIFSVKQLERLFLMLDKAIPSGLRACYTGIETAPKQTTTDKVALLHEWQINRVSIGVQSFDDKELKKLKRHHLSTDIEQSLAYLSEYAFAQFNIDLIYGLYGQTMASLNSSVEKALSWQPNEIFIYPLYTRSNAALSSQIRSPDAYQMYQFLRSKLVDSGFYQYSMRHFTRNKKITVSDCGTESVLALGVGGRSYLGNIHLCEPYSNRARVANSLIDGFVKRTVKNQFNYGYCLNEDEQKRRYVIKNLLFINGVSNQAYQAMFGRELIEDFPLLRSFIEQGYCEYQQMHFRLTPLGLSLSDYLGPQFISDDIRLRMQSGLRRE